MTNPISNNNSSPITNNFEKLATNILYAKGLVFYNDRLTHFGQMCAYLIETFSEEGQIINTSRDKLEKESGFGGDTVKKAVHFLVTEGYISKYDVLGVAREDNLLKRNAKEYSLVCEDKLIDTLKENDIKVKFDVDDLPVYHNAAIDIHNSIIESELACGRKGVTEDKLLPKREVKEKPAKVSTKSVSVSMLVNIYDKINNFEAMITHNEEELINSGNILGSIVVLERIFNDLSTYEELLAERVGPCRFRTEFETRTEKARESIVKIITILNNFKDNVDGDVLMTIIKGIY